MAAGAMGKDHGKRRRNFIKELCDDTSGDAVVEATILFPVMILVFAGLVLLSIYLPARAVLQNATQYAAIVLATEISDTWLFFDEGSMSFYRETNINSLKNVYAGLFTGTGDIGQTGESIVTYMENKSVSSNSGVLSVESSIINRILYKEVVITATREFMIPVDLSLIGFPRTILITTTSTAVVQNADEFIRNINMASDFVEFIIERYNLHNVTDAIGTFGNRVSGLFGW